MPFLRLLPSTFQEPELSISVPVGKDPEQRSSEFLCCNMSERRSPPGGDHVWGHIDSP